MLVVHHLDNSRSQRVLWLLEELGIPYEIAQYRRDPQTMLAPPALRAVHPLGKAPIVTDGDLILVESGAIIEYLIDRYGEGGFAPPAGSPERLRYTQWLHYAEGSLMPPLLLKLVFDRVETAKVPFFVKPIAKGIAHKVRHDFIDPQLRLHLDYLEAELQRSEWFAGNDFSGADIQMSFPLEAAAAGGGLGRNRPRLAAWLERIHARPAYRRALDRGGPYALLGA
ncbi:MAG: glutathione S-transferase [Dokdonella sp.]